MHKALLFLSCLAPPSKCLYSSAKRSFDVSQASKSSKISLGIAIMRSFSHLAANSCFSQSSGDQSSVFLGLICLATSSVVDVADTRGTTTVGMNDSCAGIEEDLCEHLQGTKSLSYSIENIHLSEEWGFWLWTHIEEICRSFHHWKVRSGNSTIRSIRRAMRSF